MSKAGRILLFPLQYVSYFIFWVRCPYEKGSTIPTGVECLPATLPPPAIPCVSTERREHQLHKKISSLPSYSLPLRKESFI